MQNKAFWTHFLCGFRWYISSHARNGPFKCCLCVGASIRIFGIQRADIWNAENWERNDWFDMNSMNVCANHFIESNVRFDSDHVTLTTINVKLNCLVCVINPAIAVRFALFNLRLSINWKFCQVKSLKKHSWPKSPQDFRQNLFCLLSQV